MYLLSTPSQHTFSPSHSPTLPPILSPTSQHGSAEEKTCLSRDPCQHTLSTQSINTPYQHTLLVHPLTHPLTPPIKSPLSTTSSYRSSEEKTCLSRDPCQRTFSTNCPHNPLTHPISTPYKYTLSTHPLTHPINDLPTS